MKICYNKEFLNLIKDAASRLSIVDIYKCMVCVRKREKYHERKNEEGKGNQKILTVKFTKG